MGRFEATARTGPSGSIRKLLGSEIHHYRDHLLRLDSEARNRRFAHSVSDGFVETYASMARGDGTIIFGYFADGELRGVAELKRMGKVWGQMAEAAFSVETPYLNQGIATRLMGRVIRSARNRGVRHLVLSCLVENAKMRAIATKYGADLKLQDGAIIADIVPQRADIVSFATEAFEDRIGLWLAALDTRERLRHAAASPPAAHLQCLDHE